MISHIIGIIDQKDKDFIVIDVNGVGYKTFIPAASQSQIPAIGEKIKIYTEQVVREDSVSLYGFLSKEERNLFNNLISVNGVGPKSAMAIISNIPLSKLVSAITQGNAGLITSVPGVGSKTAQKIIIDLKEKIAKQYAGRTAQMIEGIHGDTSLISDALSALVTLGYSPREAREVIMKIDLEKNKSVEEIIKVALKNLS
ncbi:MAG: holliday junction DNA helicase RuvA [Candidatus Saganbacteria bacterium]|uniref:Holliday junction branch migration complex subunit RuvA n=1 Tax=Candidatus Saganbacteria bacterium TaxID=2575572 RepID=A0A833L4N0_UNCSA|nr:MAG: holliday junction DNA helicase RuvA [Candidatus Saganbacteria bacterium]